MQDANLPDNNINPSNSNEIVKELGYAGEPSPKPGAMPAGNGKWPVPHYETFQGIYNIAQRSYYWAYDDALKASRVNAVVMRRDPVLMQALRARQMPTCQLSWHLEPQDDTDPVQQEAAALVSKIILNIPRFQELKMHLLEALWYGRFGVQMVYDWDYSSGEKRMVVRDHRPVNGDKLFFKWSGDAGILVNGQFDGEKTPDNLGMVHYLSPMEREAMIIHHFEPEDADYQVPDMAGGIMGYGIRGRLYWFWFQKQNMLALLTDYLQRCALGFTVYYFPAGNDEALRVAQTYAAGQAGQQAIFWPRYIDDKTGGYGIERIEPGMAGSQVLQHMVTQYYDDVMRKYILGQELSSETANTGIGSGVAELHSQTLSTLIKFDAQMLSETLTSDLVRILYKYNCPDVPPARFRAEIDSPNASNVMGYAEILYGMGVPLDANQLLHISGLKSPGAGDAILSKLGALQPTATSQEPPQTIPQQGSGPINTQQQ